MQFYEIDALLDSYYLKHKDGWEQARLIAYMTAQVNSRNTIKPEDIIKFHWEKDEDAPMVSEADQMSIELEMKELENILNNKS